MANSSSSSGGPHGSSCTQKLTLPLRCPKMVPVTEDAELAAEDKEPAMELLLELCAKEEEEEEEEEQLRHGIPLQPGSSKLKIARREVPQRKRR
jgi:hypothetical protein